MAKAPKQTKPDKLSSLMKYVEVILPQNNGGEAEIVRVPVNGKENRVANQIMAARMRHVIESHLDTYRGDGTKLTPAEIRQLTQAAADVAKFSGEVYPEGDDLGTGNQDKDQKKGSVQESGIIDFTALVSSKKDDNQEAAKQETTSDK